ncbi:MAG TPA: DUF899 domain-containing protein [Streptosporangiaceae bacterium]|jgi:predicted dithiol-disulfide oxidoreductase (DUF899 family)
MDLPKIVSHDEWLAARKELLAKEKAATRARDAVNAQRRELPMVEVDKEYVFEGANGKSSLLDLFEGRRQLIVYHFMWRWDLDAGCPSCSFLMDAVPHLAHLHAAHTTLAAVSRGPWPKLAGFRKRMGWTDVPFYSSYGGDFNYDFHVTLDQERGLAEYNYQAVDFEGELPGMSVFLHDGDRVFHTWSGYARSGDILLSTFNWLDLTPLGRQEDDGIMNWIRHHDKYSDEELAGR